MDKLKVGIVGLGHQGEKHIQAYRALGCDIVWGLDTDPQKEKDFTECYQPWESVSDIVSIASPDDTHASYVLAHLPHSHVFVEKPPCTTLDELKAIKKAQEQSGKHLACNLILRTAPAYIWIKNNLEMLGEIYSVEGTYMYSRLHKLTSGWRSQIFGYSVMQGAGCHMLDIAMWVTGQKPCRVMAIGNNVCSRGQCLAPNDYVQALYDFPSGMQGRITVNFGAYGPHGHLFRICGTKGMVEVDSRYCRIIYYDLREQWGRHLSYNTLPQDDRAMIKEFVRSIRDGKTLDRTTLDSTAACLAADISLKSGQGEWIEYV